MHECGRADRRQCRHVELIKETVYALKLAARQTPIVPSCSDVFYVIVQHVCTSFVLLARMRSG